MAYLTRYVILFLALIPSFSWAGYAQVSPPPSWSAGSGGAGSFNLSQAAASNSAIYRNGSILSEVSINAGGRLAKFPAAMRFAANAPRIAAGFIAVNPYLRTAASVIVWLGLAKVVYDETEKIWKQIVEGSEPISDGYLYTAQVGNQFVNAINLSDGQNQLFKLLEAYLNVGPGVMTSTQLDANHWNVCSTYPGQTYYQCETLSRQVSDCPVGSVRINGVCSVSTAKLEPLTPDQAADKIALSPMPENIPLEVPTPLPIEIPKINPIPSPDGVPSPYRIPTGDPVKLPNPDPANQPDQYRKPVVDVVPAPAPDAPWRVDLQPKDIISTDPNKLPDGAPVPAPSSGDPPPPPGSDKTQERVPGFCETNPNSIVCKDLQFDKPEPEELKKKEVPVNVNPDSGWGGNGQCPAPKTLSVSGQTFEIPFDMFCNFLSSLRPVIIAVAWLSALGIMIGGFRESSAGT